MTDERVEEVLFDINGKLASINTKLDSLNETIIKHESRLTSIEDKFNKHIQEYVTSKTIHLEDDFKTEMLKMLGKCLLIALVSLGTLAGAGLIISKIFGV